MVQGEVPRNPRSAAARAAPRALALVELPTVVDEVVDRLLTALALGEFVPGQRLPTSRELAGMLGVSRPTVHDAVLRLRSAGVVDVRRGRTGGAYVRDSWNRGSAEAVRRTLLPRRDELAEICDLRCRYEGEVARAAAERRTAAEARALSSLLSEFARARGPEAEHAADIALHDGVLRATHNAAVVQLSRDLLARVVIGVPIEPYDRTAFGEALAQHAALVEAVVAGDVERAGRVAQDHFTLATRTLERVMARADADAAPLRAHPGPPAPGRR